LKISCWSDYFIADLGDIGDVERVAKAIASDESIAMLINNAGTSTLASAAHTTALQLEAMNNVNVMA